MVKTNIFKIFLSFLSSFIGLGIAGMFIEAFKLIYKNEI